MRLGYINTLNKYATVDEQKQAILLYAKQKNIFIENFLFDSELNINYLSNINGQTVLFVQNVTVLGTNFENIIRTIQMYLNWNLSLYLIDEDIKLDSKKEFIFSNSSDICLKIFKSILSIKNKGVVASIKASGRKAGRPFNSVNKKHKLDGKEQEILSYLKKGASHNETAKKLGVSACCLNTFIRKQNLEVKCQKFQ